MKLSTQFILTTLSRTSHQVSVFVLSIILARYFTKDDYGTYLHVQLITNLVVWGVLLGIPHSIYYFLPRLANGKQFLISTFLMIFSIGFIASILIFTQIGFVSELLGNKNLIGLAVVVAAMVILLVPMTIFEPMMIASNNVKYYVPMDFAFNLLFFGSIVIPVIMDQPLETILIWIAACYAVQSFVCLITTLLIASSGVKSEGDPYSLKAQMKYSLPIGLSMGVIEVSRYTDKVIVSNQTSPEEYAVYARGAMELPVVGIIANTLDNLMMPKFVDAYKQKDIEGLVAIWHTVMRLMSAFIYPCCFFLLISADLLIPALFSDKYIDSVIIFQIYSLSLLTRISTFNVIIRAIGKTQAMLWITGFSMFFNIAITLWLIEQLGLIGAPIATVLVLTTMRMLYVRVISGYLDVPLKKVLPWNALRNAMLLSMISVIPAYTFKIYVGMELNVWVNLFIMAILYGATYLGLNKTSTGMQPDDKIIMRTALPKPVRWVI